MLPGFDIRRSELVKEPKQKENKTFTFIELIFLIG